LTLTMLDLRLTPAECLGRRMQGRREGKRGRGEVRGGISSEIELIF
jgi:hypothetical protein